MFCFRAAVLVYAVIKSRSEGVNAEGLQSCVHSALGIYCDFLSFNAGDILEHAIFLSVMLQNEKEFERNFMQLQTYYTDTRYVFLPCLSRQL